MKKIITLIIVLFCLVGCSSYDYTELTYQEILDKLENKDTFVLVIGSDTCSACANYKQTMKKVLKDTKLEIFYLNLNGLSQEDYSKAYSKFVIVSTPTTLFIKDGEEDSTYNRIIGAADYDGIISKLKSEGFLNE